MSKQIAVEVEVKNSRRGRSWRLFLEKFSIIVSRLGRNLWKREQLFPRSAPGSNFKRRCRTWAVDYSFEELALREVAGSYGAVAFMFSCSRRFSIVSYFVNTINKSNLL